MLSLGQPVIWEPIPARPRHIDDWVFFGGEQAILRRPAMYAR